jgi:hypothetical protein
MKARITKNYIRKRQANPKKFDKRSFRIKQIDSKTNLVIGCPKGKYNSKTQKCRVGTRVQSVLKKRK